MVNSQVVKFVSLFPDTVVLPGPELVSAESQLLTRAGDAVTLQLCQL